jgi:hypothetical protein
MDQKTMLKTIKSQTKKWDCTLREGRDGSAAMWFFICGVGVSG